MKVIGINQNSLRVFFIEIRFNETILSKGSAFFAGDGEDYLLFTNRHNVTGRNNETDEILHPMGGIPNNINILIPIILNENDERSATKAWQSYIIPLYFDENFEKPRWYEHPKSTKIDAVGIFFNPSEIPTKKLILSANKSWHDWEIGDLVNIIGYPYGLSADRFPLWISGYIASEPQIDYDNLPLFLIDSRTRKGQSGAPVIARFRKGDIVEIKGKKYEAQNEEVHLLGIYSGRINSESDLGRVWKTKSLLEILEVFKQKKKEDNT